MPSRLAKLASSLLLLAAAAPAALAQGLPNKPIHIVVAFPAGGPTDFVARLLADKLKGILGQSVLIENKSGANAAIGADYVAKSEPDGYTLFFTTISAVVMNPHMRADLPYDPVRDFAPVTRVVLTTTKSWWSARSADQDRQGAGRSRRKRTAACRWPRPASAACRILRSNCSSIRRHQGRARALSRRGARGDRHARRPGARLLSRSAGA